MEEIPLGQYSCRQRKKWEKKMKKRKVWCIVFNLPARHTWNPMALMENGKFDTLTPIFSHCTQESWNHWIVYVHCTKHKSYGVVPKGLLTFLGFLGNAEFSPWKRLPEFNGVHCTPEVIKKVCGCFCDSQWRFVWKTLFVLSPYGWWRINTSLNNHINFNG